MIWTHLYPPRPESDDDFVVESTYEIPGQGAHITVHTAYRLPFEAEGDDCRCPFVRFVETRIEGLTSQPIVLRGYWSQTFEDVHYHEREHFLFEPRLEEGLPVDLLNELVAADIARIYLNVNGAFPVVLLFVGLDGEIRRFSDQELVDTDF